MKKRIFVLVCLLGAGNLFAQTKPELPTNFFEKFSYALPADFDYKDSTKLATEMTKIAAELRKIQVEAKTNYTMSDSTGLYFFLDQEAIINIYLNDNQQAIDAILSNRKIRPAPVYRIPFRLIELAYAKAALQHKDDGSSAFTNALAASLKNEFNTINADFRNDIINQQKGSFTSTSTDVSWNGIKTIFDQAKQRSNNKLDFNNAYFAIFGYQNYLLRKKYQYVIESALYSVSPSRVEEKNIQIPMRDKINLNAYLYRDLTANEKLPAIVSLSPYPSGNEAMKGNVFATNGYIFIYVDTRGRRLSQGNFMPYDDDAQDFYDIIDWVSKQPWCNGKVATSGGSYLGFDQWQTIRKKYKHPALKAINPMASVGFGIDFPRNANQFYPYILQWAQFVSGKDLDEALFNDYNFWDGKNYELYKKRIPFAKLDSVAGLPNPIFQKWLSHPDFDHYWTDILPSKEDYAGIDIPVFTITGYYDADQGGAMYYYNQHQQYGNEKALKEHYVLIGPYDHGGSQWQPNVIQAGREIEKEAQIPIYKYVIWWFDWKLKNKQKPSFVKDQITYYENGSHTWKGTTTFKKLTTDSIQLYLTPAITGNTFRKDLHTLSLQKPSVTASLKYSHDIAMAIDSAFIFAQPARFSDSLYMASPYNMIFESAPFAKDAVVSDKILARIFTTLNVPDADFELSIEEITPDGKSYNFGFGNIRTRYRNGGNNPKLVKPGEIIELNFDNVYVNVKRITKGSKLRIQFQCTNTPWAEKNFGFGGVVSQESTTAPRIIEANLLMSKKYPSKIVIPITTK